MKKDSLFIRKISGYKGWILIAALFALVGSAAQIFIPNQVKQIAEYIEENINGTIDVKNVVPITLIAVALIAAYGLFTLFQSLIMSKVKGRIGCDLRRELTEKTDRHRTPPTPSPCRLPPLHGHAM